MEKTKIFPVYQNVCDFNMCYEIQVSSTDELWKFLRDFGLSRGLPKDLTIKKRNKTFILKKFKDN